MDRRAVVAGRFYPGDKETLYREVREYLGRSGPTAGNRTMLAMAPHAGYVYSGAAAGITLGRANLPQTLLLLGPNHTGAGPALSMWPDGEWLIPGGGLMVEANLARLLAKAEPRFIPDHSAHQNEHSLEVMLPFLRAKNKETRIVPVCVSENRPEVLAEAAGYAAAVLKDWPEEVSIVVSSDMSHFISVEQAEKMDKMALDMILKLDPEGLYSTVRRNNITMCGVLPMTLGLMICRELGASKAELAAYDTSAAASGDRSRVVGYAGVLVE